jgi:hypothetical protein
VARPSQRITSAELRRIFNDDALWERAQSGEFEQRVLRARHPAPRQSGEPYCTESQIVGYFLPNGTRIAMVHQYLRPNGSVGASGRPDPKAILKGGTIYLPGAKGEESGSA